MIVLSRTFLETKVKLFIIRLNNMIFLSYEIQSDAIFKNKTCE